MKLLILTITLLLNYNIAQAYNNCDFMSSDNCETDNNGNTRIKQQNLSGGYNTYNNGKLESQTSPNLQGRYNTYNPDNNYRNNGIDESSSIYTNINN